MTNAMPQDSNGSKAALDRYGVREIIRSLLRVFIMLAVLLVSAGSIKWINAWVYAGLGLFGGIVIIAVLIKANPELLNARGRGFRENTRTFDKVLLALFAFLATVTLVVAGLDVVRYAWSKMSLATVAVGVAIHLFSCSLALWAMAVNPHFEGTVRIQDDRGHRVCTAGPYRIIRHPGYMAMIMGTLCIPLILGSIWALVPGVLAAASIVVRTGLEDHMLMKELPGYAEFAESTRYQLVPLLW